MGAHVIVANINTSVKAVFIGSSGVAVFDAIIAFATGFCAKTTGAGAATT